MTEAAQDCRDSECTAQRKVDRMSFELFPNTPTAAPREAAMADPCDHAPLRDQGTVMAFTQGLRGYASQHEQMTRMEVVRRLARLKGFTVADEAAVHHGSGPLYLVPSDTLVGLDRARALGILGKQDLFGGVVPHAFVATKAITHGLVAPDAYAPAGWNPLFAELVHDAVLPGYTVFNREDARRAGHALLRHGRLRVKPVRATGGRGQSVAENMAALEARLQDIDDDEFMRDGLVIEQNLESDVQTLSVGQVEVAGIQASYYGYQRLTRDNRGEEVYGGSDLVVVRGDYAHLLARPLPDEVRQGIEQALVYDSAASRCYAGFFASRTNYDVVQGRAAAGERRSGVLEQSWRAGGATGAEIAALEAFSADPSCNRVRASCVEVFGDSVQPPPGAVVYFRGVDDRVGPLTKYTVVQDDAHTP